MSPESLINTSVDDCRSSLKCLLETVPGEVFALAVNALLLMDARGIEQKSRRAVLTSFKRRAERAFKDYHDCG